MLQARQLCRHWGLKPKKSLGQHFLTDEGVLANIVEAAQLSSQDVIVEVGPGLGTLTRSLAARAGHVIAVEVDPQLVSHLKVALASLPNVQVVLGDGLEVEPRALTQGRAYKVVANIPYYITSPLLRHFLEAEHKPQLMVVMVQKEVAQAIAALPGDMSLLSVLIQFYSLPQVVAYVSAQSFYPAPRVDSAILRLEVLPKPPVEVDRDAFFRAVAAGFAAPRKQLRNSLAIGLGLEPSAVAQRLRQAGLEPQRRPQTLSLEEWQQVWAAFPVEIGA